jgi:hypothetical protein
MLTSAEVAHVLDGVLHRAAMAPSSSLEQTLLVLLQLLLAAPSALQADEVEQWHSSTRAALKAFCETPSNVLAVVEWLKVLTRLLYVYVTAWIVLIWCLCRRWLRPPR